MAGGGSIIALTRRVTDMRFARYLVASVGALAADIACFMLLLGGGAAPAVASAVGYCVGIVAHWLLSSRTVFTDGVAARGIARTRQKALFVGSALVGLALTTAIVGLGAKAGFDPRLAKLVAIAVSFLATWLIRSRIVFLAPAEKAHAAG